MHRHGHPLVMVVHPAYGFRKVALDLPSGSVVIVKSMTKLRPQSDRQRPPGGAPSHHGRPTRSTWEAEWHVEWYAGMIGDFEEGVFPGGARGTRTPDPLLANRRQYVHRHPSPQLTVLARVTGSVRIRVGCCTFLLYSPAGSAAVQERCSTACRVSRFPPSAACDDRRPEVACRGVDLTLLPNRGRCVTTFLCADQHDYSRSGIPPEVSGQALDPVPKQPDRRVCTRRMQSQ